MRIFYSYIAGLLFGLGIAISGMANPAKVLNFFDLAGSWDPSLAFVMGGALVVTLLGYRFVLKRPSPLQSAAFHLPQARQIDRKLLAGSAVFGVGWGIAGFCPGGALPVLGLGDTNVLIFVGAMVAGIVLAKIVTSKSGSAPVAEQA